MIGHAFQLKISGVSIDIGPRMTNRIAVPLIFVFLGIGQGAPRPTRAVADLLVDYDRGDYQASLQGFADAVASASLSRFRSRLEHEAPTWIAAAGTEAASHRRVVVAAFVVEAVHAVYASHQTRTGLGPLQDAYLANHQTLGPAWEQDLRPMMEWACALLRTSPTPAPAEREWFLASVQLFKDFHDLDAFPLTAHGVDPSHGSVYASTPGHLGHAVTRFPKEPWFRLIDAERRTGNVFQFGRRLNAARSGTPAVEYRGPGSDAEGPAISSDYQMAAKALAEVEDDGSVGAESHLYLGAISLAFGRFEEARILFEGATLANPSPCLAYVADFLRGRISGLENRPEDAESAFRAALAVVPRAQSASTGLGALLSLAANYREATVVVDDALVEPIADDPWTAVFTDRGCSRWSPFIAGLRAGLR